MGKEDDLNAVGAGPHDPAVDQKPQQRLVFRVCAVREMFTRELGREGTKGH